MAWPSNVLPVPVSPSNTTGTSDLAAKRASRMHRAIASLVVRNSSTLRVESLDCILILVANTFLQLFDRLEGILDQRSLPGPDSRFAFHADTQR